MHLVVPHDPAKIATVLVSIIYVYLSKTAIILWEFVVFDSLALFHPLEFNVVPHIKSGFMILLRSFLGGCSLVERA